MCVWLQEDGSRRRDLCAWAARRSGENLATAGQGNATTTGSRWQLTAHWLLAEGDCCMIWWSLLALASSTLVMVALPGPCSQTSVSLLSFQMELPHSSFWLFCCCCVFPYHRLLGLLLLNLKCRHWSFKVHNSLSVHTRARQALKCLHRCWLSRNEEWSFSRRVQGSILGYWIYNMLANQPWNPFVGFCSLVCAVVCFDLPSGFSAAFNGPSLEVKGKLNHRFSTWKHRKLRWFCCYF